MHVTRHRHGRALKAPLLTRKSEASIDATDAVNVVPEGRDDPLVAQMRRIIEAPYHTRTVHPVRELNYGDAAGVDSAGTGATKRCKSLHPLQPTREKRRTLRMRHKAHLSWAMLSGFKPRHRHTTPVMTGECVTATTSRPPSRPALSNSASQARPTRGQNCHMGSISGAGPSSDTCIATDTMLYMSQMPAAEPH